MYLFMFTDGFCGGGGFFLAYENFGRMFDNSCRACALFLFFVVVVFLSGD